MWEERGEKSIFAANSLLFCGKKCINLCMLGSKSSGEVNLVSRLICIAQGGL